MPSDDPITAVYIDIGRGHPNYLDSVLRYLQRNHPNESKRVRTTSVFAVSHGMSLFGWNCVRRLYKFGARGGVVSRVYSRFRSRQSRYGFDSTIVRILRRDLERYLDGYDGICLVAHPLAANMLKERHRVFYVHGEIAAPRESAVADVERIYVPLPSTRRRMLQAGVRSESLMETGLVLEPELCVDLRNTIRKRLERIEHPDVPLTAGFFISGSYPKRHVELMTTGAESLHAAGFRIRMFWGCDNREVEKLLSIVTRFDEAAFLHSSAGAKPEGRETVVVAGDSRSDETVRSADYFPELDVFCAAPHEWTNWAVGAGLPMIAITPTIGTYAPENLAFVMKSGSGIALSEKNDYASLAEVVLDLRRSGKLSDMVRSGCGIKSVDGARIVAEDLIKAIHG
jgi:hypothetical protein